MRSAAIDFESRRVELRRIEPPPPPAAGQVLFRVHEVGICGTDRELAAFHIGSPPLGESFLVLGHEALGQVEAVGPGVPGLSPGDWVAPMVRRPCQPACVMCIADRRDLCVSGRYTDRGVFGAHGYLTGMALDLATDLIPVPAAIARFGVLIEPLSVVEKAIEVALRTHQGEPRTALAIGAGPIGLLAAMVMVARGLRVTLHSREPRGHVRARLAEAAGARYQADERTLEKADIVIEAGGNPRAGFLALDRLAPLGVCGLLGARPGKGTVPFRRMILENQALFGSVNASPEACRTAVTDLQRFDPKLLDAMLRRVPLDAFPATLAGPAGEAVKLVHVID